MAGKTAGRGPIAGRAAPPGGCGTGALFVWAGVIVVVLVLIGVAINRLPHDEPVADTHGGAPQGTVHVDEPHHDHVKGAVQYDRTPPIGGDHSDAWLNCGIYDQAVPNEQAVHSMEHGAVWITYLPSLRADDVATLRALVSSKYQGRQRYVVLSPFAAQSAPVMAQAWGEQLAVDSASDPRIAAFIENFRQGKQTLEPGAPCSGGSGSPVA